MGDGAPEEGEPGLVQALQLQAGLHKADDGHSVLPHRQTALSLLQELLPHAVRLQQCHPPAGMRMHIGHVRDRPSGVHAFLDTPQVIAKL